MPRTEVGGDASGRQLEPIGDELILLADLIVADAPHRPFADHVHRLVNFNRSPRSSELAKALLGLHSSFYHSMILLQDVVQILDRSMAAAAAQQLFQFGTVRLQPRPKRRAIRLQIALGVQLVDIAQRQRVAKTLCTAPGISSGAVCRHLKTAGRVTCFTIFSAYQPPPPKSQYIQNCRACSTLSRLSILFPVFPIRRFKLAQQL